MKVAQGTVREQKTEPVVVVDAVLRVIKLSCASHRAQLSSLEERGLADRGSCWSGAMSDFRRGDDSASG